MKAIRINEHVPAESLKIVDNVEIPNLASGQVLVSIRAAGVNPVDTYIRSGINNYTASFPHILGKDGAGVIEAIGADVAELSVGDRVYVGGCISGTYAEKALCDSNQVYALPANVSFEQGACLGIPYATAWRPLFQRAKAVAGETLLIHGASGGVGLALCQMGRAAGLTVIGTASSSSGRDLVLQNGAHHAFDHSQPDCLDIVKSLASNGVDIIIEMLANLNLGKDLPVLAKNGRVVIVGSRGSVEINPRDLMARDACVMGCALFNTSASEMKSIHRGIFAGLENGSLRPVIGQTFPLCDASKAHIAVMKSPAFGNVVLFVE